MNIVIVGAGNVGSELVEQLAIEDHNIVIIDTQREVVEDLVNSFDVKGICGNGASHEILSEASVSSSDLVIACTQNDELNILCCLLAKSFGAGDTIARVRNPDYFKLFKEKNIDLSMMVNPEFEAALEISRNLRYQQAIKIEPFANGKVEIVEIKIEAGSLLDGLKLYDIHTKLSIKFLVTAVERGDEVIIPSGPFEMKAEDKIYILGSTKDIFALFKKLGIARGAKRVMIIGGSRIAIYLAEELDKADVKVKIIEKDKDRCSQLDEELTKAEIIYGDGTNQDLLIDEGLLDSDAVVSLCPIDEQNIIISLFALSNNIEKIITKIDKSTYSKMLSASGLDSIVSLRKSTADEIIRYVRSKENSKGSKVSRLYSIISGKAEAIEFIVNDSFNGLSTTLKELKTVPNILIGGIIRNEKLIIPGGMDTIEINDSVIVVSAIREEQLDDLNDILE